MFSKNKFRALLLLLFLSPFFCWAENKTIIINEIAWMGTEQSHYDEWMELKNITDKTINITGWQLKAEAGSPDIKLAGEIAPKGFFILERTDDNTLPQIKADMIYTGALNNKGETIRLINNKGETVDVIEAREGWPAGDNQNKRTMERKKSGLPGEGAEWQSSQNPGGTPETENSDGFKLKKVQTSRRPRLLKPEAYYKPANKRFTQVLFPGLSLALLCSGLAVIMKRRIVNRN